MNIFLPPLNELHMSNDRLKEEFLLTEVLEFCSHSSSNSTHKTPRINAVEMWPDLPSLIVEHTTYLALKALLFIQRNTTSTVTLPGPGGLTFHESYQTQSMTTPLPCQRPLTHSPPPTDSAQVQTR